tara:strand:- start:1576 stop:1980 length:405 start_codon:yes stop_codon:yes gene_type:complete
LPFGYSARLPLQYDPTDGPYSLLKDIRSVGQQNLKMLILTIPGERIMNPDFGVGLSQYIFNQEGNFSSGEIENRILNQVDRYLSYIKITNINIFERTDLSNTYEITIEYFIPSIANNQTLILNLSPQDPGATGF